MPHKIELNDIGALPVAYGRETSDPTILQDDDVFLTVRCTNVGDEPTDKALTVTAYLTLQGSEVYKDHKEVGHLQPGDGQALSWDVPTKLAAGDYHLAMVAWTREIGEHDPYHILEWTFSVPDAYRHVEVLDFGQQEGSSITGEVAGQTRDEKATGMKRVRATVALWDFDGQPLRDHFVRVTDEGQNAHEGEMNDGKLEFPDVLIHEAPGFLLVQCFSRQSQQWDIQGNLQYTPQGIDIVLNGWQDWEPQTFSNQTLHSVQVQLTASVKASFKIFDTGGIEVGGSYSNTTTDASAMTGTWRVKLAKTDLLSQMPQHSGF